MTISPSPQTPDRRGPCLIAALLIAAPVQGHAATPETGLPARSGLTDALPQAGHYGQGTIYTPAVTVEVMPDPVSMVLLSLAAVLLLAGRALRAKQGPTPG